MVCGMVLLALTIADTLLLLLHVVVPSLLAELLVAGVMMWFALCWYVLPVLLRRRSVRRSKAYGAALRSQDRPVPHSRQTDDESNSAGCEGDRYETLPRPLGANRS